MSVTGGFRSFPTFKVLFVFQLSRGGAVCTVERQLPAPFPLSRMSVFVVLLVLRQPPPFLFRSAPVWGGHAPPRRALSPPFAGGGVFTVPPPRRIAVLSTPACPLQTPAVRTMGVPLGFLLFPVLLIAIPVPSLTVLPTVIGPVGIHLSATLWMLKSKRRRTKTRMYLPLKPQVNKFFQSISKIKTPVSFIWSGSFCKSGLKPF